ncbi:MAG: hypothetical protein RLZZ500_1010 [Bacteroidota bacterium]
MPTELKKNQNKFVEYISKTILNLHKNIFDTEAYKTYVNDAPELQKYIELSRLQKENAQINFAYYDTIYLFVEKVLRKHNLFVTFHTIYSLNRKNETVTLNGRKFIIYDQYLGKTFNLFNKAFLQLKDSKPLDHYCTRYLVESFRVRGMGLESDIVINFGLKTDSFLKLNKAYSSESTISAYTYIQETFIIFHEIAHLIVNENTRYLSFRFKQINDYIDKQPSSIFNKINESDSRIGSFELDLHRRKNLIEEIVCDYIATKYTFESLFELNLLKPQDFCEAIYLGLRTMRSLNLMDGYIDSYSMRKSEHRIDNLSQLFKESSVRFWLIKDSISSMYKTKYRKKFKTDPLVNLLMKDIDKYSEFYEDPFHRVNHLLDILAKTIPPEIVKKVSFNEQLEVLNYTDKVLGRIS